MNIAIDGRTIVHSRSGVGVYAERIVRGLLRIDRKNQYFLFLTAPADISAPNLHCILIEGYERMILNRWWENFLLPVYSTRFGFDAYFSPAYALPFLPRFRRWVSPLPLPDSWKAPFNPLHRPSYIVTIHDVISSVMPHTFTPRMRLWQNLFNANAAVVADHIITDSHSTKKDFLQYFGGPPQNVSVIHLSADEQYKPVTRRDTLNRVRSKYRLPSSFILYLGTIEPRKNVGGLARAYSRLPARLRAQYPLVISGAKGWYSDPIMEEIHSLGISESVHVLGFADHEDLPALYTLARVFVYPSLYEGFGYPPLEAMSCGTPVITSNTSSLPEVVGDAAILINPQDESSLVREMTRLLKDKRLQTSMRSKGLERAKQFRWEETARKTLEIILSTTEKVAGSRSKR